MKKNIIVAIAMLLSIFASGQVMPPPAGPPPPPPGLPINSAIWVLFLGGLLYGMQRKRKYKNSSS